MSRNEFMRQLEVLLSGISESEKEEAIQYYNEYFNDAGPENEQEVLNALGTPAKVAENIKADLNGRDNAERERYEYTESGVYDGKQAKRNEIAIPRAEVEGYGKKEEKKNMSPVSILLIILAVVLLFPIWVPVVAVAFGVVVAVVATILSLLFAVAVCGIAFLFSGIILFVVGIAKMFAVPVAGLIITGVGLILTAFGILFLLATTWLFAKAMPAIINGIVVLCKRLFGKKEEKAA